MRLTIEGDGSPGYTVRLEREGEDTIYDDKLCAEEVLGVVAAYLPLVERCAWWLKTPKKHQQWAAHIARLGKDHRDGK